MPTKQIELPNGAFSGQFSAEIVEGPPSLAPIGVIRNDQEWRIRCEWTLDGLLAPGLDGTWSLQAVVEGFGTALEVTGGLVNVPLSDAPPSPLPRPYAKDIVFPPNSVNLGGQPSVMAHIAVALTYRFPVGVGGQPGPIATFVDLGTVQIFDAQ